MCDVAVQTAICARALKLECLGEYWGWADWIAWGWHSQTRVHMLLGGSRTDLFVPFCSPAVRDVSRGWASDVFVIACRVSGSIEGLKWDQVNHFVHATPLFDVHSEVPVAPADDDTCWSIFEKQLGAILEVSSFAGADAEIFSTYLERGWAVQFTICDGNCACDTIAVHQQTARTAAQWLEIRKHTAQTMRDLSAEAWFRNAFVLAQEYIPHEVVVDPLGSVADDSDADGAGSLLGGDDTPPVVLGGDTTPPVAGEDPGDASSSEHGSSSSSSSGRVSGAAGCGPEPDARASVSDAAVFTWAMRRTDTGRELLDDFGAPDNEDVLNIVALEELVALRQEYAIANPRPRAHTNRLPVTKNSKTIVTQRLDTGRRYLEWLDEQPEDVRRHGLRHYAAASGYDEPVPKSVRQGLYRCYKEYERSLVKPGEFVLTLPGKAAIIGPVKPHQRFRRIGIQGRPVKCPELHFLLFQWFVDYRKVVKGRIWPRTVILEAMAIKDRIKAWYKASGKRAPSMPKLDYGKTGRKWIGRWKRKLRISFKKCARKFKVSRDKILRRTRRTWLNTWSAMLIFCLLFGEQRARLGLPCWPYFQTGDQKGVFLNEAESKNCGSFAFAGDDQDAALKTHHAQSRSRVSAWTLVTNDPACNPWLGICFKLKTDRCLKKLVLPPGSKIVLDHSKSGSYDYNACMSYLKRTLPAWTDERRAIFDYRIYMLDDYRVHNMKEVKDLCWKHGVLKVKIGGGCTFAQCNCDLDCHADMESQYLELDNQWAASELKERPWRVPEKDRQSVLDDMAVIWHSHPHARKGIDSFKWSGNAARPPTRVVKPDGQWEVPLTGPDDWLINRDARTFFNANNMGRERKICLTNIYKCFDEGKIREWEDVQNYIFDHSDSEGGGEHDEGAELLSEKALSDGPETDLDEDCPPGIDDGSDGDGPAGGAIVAAASDGLALAAVESPESAIGKADRAFTELIEHARTRINDPRLVQTLLYYQKQRERALRSVNKDALQEIQQERQQALDKAAVDRKKLYTEDKERLEALRVERQKRKEKEAAAAVIREHKKQLAIDALKVDKKDWDLVHFGQGKKALTKEVVANMQEVMERLRLRAPELPPHVAAIWPHFVEHFPKWLWDKELGAPKIFMHHVTDVQVALGSHYMPNPLKPEKRRKIEGGNPDALSNWVQQMLDKYGVGRLKL